MKPSLRTAPGIAVLLALTACIVSLSFDMKKPLALQSQTAGSVSQSVLVDLGQYQAVTDHKTQIKSLDLDYAEVTVSHVNAGTAATVSGTLKLRTSLAPGATDVKVGDFGSLTLQVGTTKRLSGTPELDAFLLQRFHEQGTFYAVIDGTVDGAANVVLDVNLRASIGYDAGLF